MKLFLRILKDIAIGVVGYVLMFVAGFGIAQLIPLDI